MIYKIILSQALNKSSYHLYVRTTRCTTSYEIVNIAPVYYSDWKKNLQLYRQQKWGDRHTTKINIQTSGSEKYIPKHTISVWWGNQTLNLAYHHYHQSSKAKTTNSHLVITTSNRNHFDSFTWYKNNFLSIKWFKCMQVKVTACDLMTSLDVYHYSRSQYCSWLEK